MPKDLVISREAIRDLEGHWDYIASDNIEKADQFIDRLYEKCNDIAKYDAVGRKRDELMPGLLSVACKNRIIFFFREATEIQIVRILHGAQDIEQFFD